MTDLMRAYRLLAWGRPPELVEVPVPQPEAGQVLVEVAGCGLCHSDLTMTAMPREVGEALGWEVPFTLGHEVGGVVAAVGHGVTVAVGSPVAVASPTACGRCWFCRHGRDSACPTGDVGRGYGRDGGLARFVLVDDERALVDLDGLDPRHAGPLTDAGATSHHAVRRALAGGHVESVAVIGAGGLGSFALQILKASGVRTVVAVDIDPARRETARGLGADAFFDGGSPDVGRLLRDAGDQGRDGIDAVIDVVGSDDTIRTGLSALRRGGTFVLVGAAGGTLRRPWLATMPREVTVTCVQGSSRRDLRAVVDLAAADRIRVVVDEFTLSDVASAYAALDAGRLSGRAVVVP